LILALLATLGAIVTVFVLYPVFTQAPASGPATLDEVDLELSDLGDKKAMLYEAIQDLDFEKDSGKISEADYESARNDYLAQVAAVIEKMDALAPAQPAPENEAKKTKKTPSTKKTTPQGELACTNCGADNPRGSKFCIECGAAFTVKCASCGESLPAKAKFCNACGEKVTA
jgi:hypothetical protein